MNQNSSTDFHLGTVTDVSSAGVKIILDGHSAALEKRYKQLNTGRALAVDDRVVVMKMSGTYIIMGKISYDNAGGGGGGAPPSITVPLPDGTAAVGTEEAYARGDHVHPLMASPAMIPYANVGAASTSTAFVATVDGITELKNGTAVILRNNRVDSASGCTLNVNGLGAKPIYIMNLSDSRLTSGWYDTRTALFVYNTVRLSTGCWDYAELWDTNTTYSLSKFGIGYCKCNTAKATLAKEAVFASYGRSYGQIFFCSFKYDVPAGSTLSINNSPATDIYINNVGGYDGTTGSEKRAIVDGDILAGDCCLMQFDGVDYVVRGIDRYMLPAS